MARSVFSAGYAHFRRLLVEARREAGLSQAALSTRLGRPQSFVSKYEQGERRLDVIEFLEIADALKISPGTFVAHLRKIIKTGKRPKTS